MNVQREPQIGETWRSVHFAPRFIVTDLDDRFVYVRRADSTKKMLASGGGYPVGRNEWRDEWIPLDALTDRSRIVARCHLLEIALREWIERPWKPHRDQAISCARALRREIRKAAA